MGRLDNYIIVEGISDLYLAKPLKRETNRMSMDRRRFTEQEILGIIHWYAKKVKHITISCDGQPAVELKLLEDRV